MDVNQEKYRIMQLILSQDKTFRYLLLRDNQSDTSRLPSYLDEGYLFLWEKYFVLMVKRLEDKNRLPHYQFSFIEPENYQFKHTDFHVKKTREIYEEDIREEAGYLEFYINSYIWALNEDSRLDCKIVNHLIATYDVNNGRLYSKNRYKLPQLMTLRKNSIVYLDYHAIKGQPNPINTLFEKINKDDEELTSQEQMLLYMEDYILTDVSDRNMSSMMKLLEAVQSVNS